MDRREALMSMISGLAVGNPSVRAVDPPFRLIDERVDGRITLGELRDGECGYISSGCIGLSKTEDVLYFSICPEYSTVQRTPESFGDFYTWVGRKGDNYYVLPSERAMTEPFTWKGNPSQDQWLQRPAMLAYTCSYPLELDKRVYPIDKEDDGGLFVVPADWKECAKHKLVERNLAALVAAVYAIKDLKNQHGITTGFSRWDHTNEKLKKALEPVPLGDLDLLLPSNLL